LLVDQNLQLAVSVSQDRVVAEEVELAQRERQLALVTLGQESEDSPGKESAAFLGLFTFDEQGAEPGVGKRNRGLGLRQQVIIDGAHLRVGKQVVSTLERGKVGFRGVRLLEFHSPEPVTEAKLAEADLARQVQKPIQRRLGIPGPPAI